jgi:hypothetical protein
MHTQHRTRIARFRAAFEACAVQPAEFNHEAHLRLAYVYLVEDGPSSHQRIRRSVLAFPAHHGVPLEKYHETVSAPLDPSNRAKVLRQIAPACGRFACPTPGGSREPVLLFSEQES